ncbi:CHAT domain-containing protein [Suillus plorans]|uniref:CHAT domain-containing protein n=1 Tax=Suillus plorans TaxID=116603 RepID=A0A9P7AKQ9_9AGAM|nr:CHAT domain-containing protein [Suillus plorans]KAG1790427.1 CHAT domain-containing protein [Suillus plorans]
MPGSSEGRYIRLDVISGKNFQVPSGRIPAGIHISVNVDSRRRWKSAISFVSPDESVVWGNSVTLLSHSSPALSVEIRASFELGRMFGSGEIVGRLRMPWNELLSHRHEPFDISLPPVHGVHPSLKLKATIVHACNYQDDALFDSLVDCKIARDTDAGHAQIVKYVRRKTVSHLKRAVDKFQSVLDQCPVSHSDHATALTNLACARLLGYVRNDVEDIDAITSLFRDALALRPQPHPDHPLSLFNLARALTWRHYKKNTAADIREAAQLHHELLPLCPEATYLRSIAAGNGVDYVISGCSDIPIDASDEGIHLRRVVLELCPLGHQLRHRALNMLACAVKGRFDQHGSIDDLDTSIQLHREALSLIPEGHADRDTYLYNLAVTLTLRFQHQSKPNDLDDAISLHEEALRLRPVGHKYRDRSLNKLGIALVVRFNQRGDIDDITRAIGLKREALTLQPPGHPHRDATLNNLALALKVRHDKSHVSEDLNEAIDLYRESLRLKQLDHPERPATILGLSSVLCSRFTQTQQNEDVEEAITLCQQSFCLHYTRTGVSATCGCKKPIWLNFRLASGHPTQGFPERIKTACNWTIAAEQHGDLSALEAYSTCFDLLDGHLATRSSTISRREAAAAFSRSLPVDAASCAIRRDNLRRAVELVEQGRGQQWSLASRLRTPVEDLESANPKLACSYLQLSKRVSNAAQSSATITDRAAADRAATEYRRLTRQWEAAVAEIRDLPAFTRFLLPPSYEDLQAAARQGPVIILVASQYSCSAIIVPTSGDPHHVPLPSIALADLKILKDRFTRAIRDSSRMNPGESRTDLIVLLRIIWDQIMLPIVDVLEHVLKLQRRSRIWLCPTAAFTSIPLHAAHPFQTKPDRSGKEPCLEDLYICSYTPTLSALIRSRQLMKKRVPPSFVAIGQGQPGAGKGKALLAVDNELELVHKLVPATSNRTTISGDAATRAGALEALQQNTWVHLACHGKQDPTQPYDSHFVMKDEHLTLLDIMERHIPQAEFAFLSACHTAVGDEETLDEVIHLAAGIQFSGFKSVVGTLWEVDDSVAKHVVEAFYGYMFGDLTKGGVMDCTRAAWALNCATHAVKTKVPLEQRMVFVHIGV